MDVRKPIATNGGYWLPKFGDLWKTQIEALKAQFGKAIEEVRMPPDYPTDVPIVYVRKDEIVPVLNYLKTDSKMDYGFLADLTATDEQKEPRFEVVYNLFSHSSLCRIRVKVRVADGDEVPTAISVWEGANWAEREVYDMFGVKFRGHPDLRRILMDIRWVGHPLRKDYPLKGYQVFADAEPVDPTLLD
ncbi:MAG: NADH-quinone oxidoreductase subunit C [Bdellovibrio sp.]|nr:NADH-quinone oxidoreductase subunit C [Bdellovibrio sp.]